MKTNNNLKEKKYYRLEHLLANCFIILDEFGIKKITKDSVLSYRKCIENYFENSTISDVEYLPVRDEKSYLETHFNDYFSLNKDGKAWFYECKENISKIDLILGFYGEMPDNFKLASSTKDAKTALLFTRYRNEDTNEEILIGKYQLIRDRLFQNFKIPENLFEIEILNTMDYRKQLVRKMAIDYSYILEKIDKNECKELLGDMLEIIFSLSESFDIAEDELMLKRDEMKEQLGGYQKHLYLKDTI